VLPQLSSILNAPLGTHKDPEKQQPFCGWYALVLGLTRKQQEAHHIKIVEQNPTHVVNPRIFSTPIFGDEWTPTQLL